MNKILTIIVFISLCMPCYSSLYDRYIQYAINNCTNDVITSDKVRIQNDGSGEYLSYWGFSCPQPTTNELPSEEASSDAARTVDNQVKFQTPPATAGFDANSGIWTQSIGTSISQPIYFSNVVRNTDNIFLINALNIGGATNLTAFVPRTTTKVCRVWCSITFKPTSGTPAALLNLELWRDGEFIEILSTVHGSDLSATRAYTLSGGSSFVPPSITNKYYIVINNASGSVSYNTLNGGKGCYFNGEIAP
jgi:hypothetical protein